MYKIKPVGSVNKEVVIPADKSISHRGAIISAISKGKTVIKPFLFSEDTIATINCLKKMGVKISKVPGGIAVYGVGKYFLRKKKVTLYAHESGTTMRILSGILVAQKFPVEFAGAPSLNNRPMGRIVEPLTKMGADISGLKCPAKKANIYPPLNIKPVKTLTGIKYNMPVSSAQIKSAVLFASLYSEGVSTVKDPFLCRDHTERMLGLFKAKIKVRVKTVCSDSVKSLKSPKKIFIPSDFSSAAFFIVLGLLLKDSQIILKNVNINPTRIGLLRVLKRMGANIKVVNRRNDYEPYADLVVRSSKLKSTIILKKEIPSMIDEVPILCVASAFAFGTTVIQGVDELIVKETDRVASMLSNLKDRALGKNNIKVGKDKKSKETYIKITGGSCFKSGDFLSYSDHRTAMSMIIFGMAKGDISSIDDIGCINKSFPEFIEIIESFYETS